MNHMDGITKDIITHQKFNDFFLLIDQDFLSLYKIKSN